MASLKTAPKDKSERVLVLVADIDNDLYRKTKIGGPLFGRVQNLNGATQLALADPEDTDSNAMFEAVKIYDQLKEEGYSVSIATVTGSEKEGYDADREIARQLEMILEQSKADGCVFISDGASDSRVLPIIQSRIKVNSVKYVTVKQAESLENTYFTILEKLKEPHYARIVFGIPALLILIFAVSYLLGAGWELPSAAIGLYLLIKGFGLEESLIDSFRGFGFSMDRMSFAFYLGAIVFLIASIFVGFGSYNTQMHLPQGESLAAYYGIRGFMLLLPVTLILYLVGRIIDVKSTRYLFRSFKYGTYIGSSIILWVLLYSFLQWIIGQIYFAQFVDYTIVAITVGVLVSIVTNVFRKRILATKRLRGKLVVNELGALIGKVASMDAKKGIFVINTNFGNPINYNVDRIVEISDKVVVK